MFDPRKVLWYVRRRILFFVGACRVDCGASSGACRPMGRSHFSFGGERKVCKRKPAARRLREKALYCPFLKEGVRNVARSMVKLTAFTFVRARAHSFPLSKRARLFPFAAYRRSAPPRLAIDRLKWRCFRGFGAARMISQCGKTGLIFLLGWRRAYSSSAAVDIFDISVTQNASVVSNPRWHLLRAGGPGARRRSFLFN